MCYLYVPTQIYVLYVCVCVRCMYGLGSTKGQQKLIRAHTHTHTYTHIHTQVPSLSSSTRLTTPRYVAALALYRCTFRTNAHTHIHTSTHRHAHTPTRPHAHTPTHPCSRSTHPWLETSTRTTLAPPPSSCAPRWLSLALGLPCTQTPRHAYPRMHTHASSVCRLTRTLNHLSHLYTTCPP